jgi:hypothetical protein
MFCWRWRHASYAMYVEIKSTIHIHLALHLRILCSRCGKCAGMSRTIIFYYTILVGVTYTNHRRSSEYKSAILPEHTFPTKIPKFHLAKSIFAAFAFIETPCSYTIEIRNMAKQIKIKAISCFQ